MPTETIYWDSCVFIDRIQRTPGRIAVIEQITNAAERGDVVLVTSALTLAEVVKGPEGLLPVEQEQLIIGLFENPYIRLRPVDRLVAEKAREVGRLCSMKPPDAIHVATAILASDVSVLHTFDEAMIRKCSLVSLGITVQLPHWRQDLQLPLSLGDD